MSKLDIEVAVGELTPIIDLILEKYNHLSYTNKAEVLVQLAGAYERKEIIMTAEGWVHPANKEKICSQ
jgi:hypothetical protein